MLTPESESTPGYKTKDAAEGVFQFSDSDGFFDVAIAAGVTDDVAVAAAVVVVVAVAFVIIVADAVATDVALKGVGQFLPKLNVVDAVVDKVESDPAAVVLDVAEWRAPLYCRR